MGIGDWIKDKWQTATGEKTLNTTRQYLEAGVTRIENLEKGYDFLRQNAVVKDDFESMGKRFQLLIKVTWTALALAAISTVATIYLLVHTIAR